MRLQTPYKRTMPAFDPFNYDAPSAAPNAPGAAPNATGCDADGFFTSYHTASRLAMVLAFAALGVALGLVGIVAVLVRLLQQLDVVVRKLRAESLAEVRGGLLPAESVDDPENRSGRSGSGGGRKGKRGAKKHVDYGSAENDDDVEHRL